MLKNKWLSMGAFALVSLCAMMFVGCTLEDDIEKLRERVVGEQGIPTGVTATALSSSSIRINWNSVPDVDYYNIYRSSSASSTYAYVGYSYSTSYTDTGLSANTTYYYKVSTQNYDDDKESPQSEYASATTNSSGGGGGNTPGTPTGVTATALSSSSIEVSWNTVSNVTSYHIYRSSSASGTYSYVDWTYSTLYTDTGLSANTTYYYKVSAINYNGVEGSQSAYASATTSSSSGGGYGSGPIDLTYGEYYHNSLAYGAVHQYRFYAYATPGVTYYVAWDDIDNSYGSYADITVGVKREGASSYTVYPTDSDGGNTIYFTPSTSGYYIIEVQGLSSSSSGMYSICYYTY